MPPPCTYVALSSTMVHRPRRRSRVSSTARDGHGAEPLLIILLHESRIIVHSPFIRIFRDPQNDAHFVLTIFDDSSPFRSSPGSLTHDQHAHALSPAALLAWHASDIELTPWPWTRLQRDSGEWPWWPWIKWIPYVPAQFAPSTPTQLVDFSFWHLGNLQDFAPAKRSCFFLLKYPSPRPSELIWISCLQKVII